MDFFKKILNSTGLQTAIELAVGLAAFVIYWMQKRDRLKVAATTLLLEIQQAERAIDRARECIRRGDLNVDLHILQGDSWDDKKYLFTKVFDKDEWDAVTEFYRKARLLDESFRHAKQCFDNDVEQIRTNKQRIFADISKETVDALAADNGANKEAILKTMNDKMIVFDKLYMNSQNMAYYNPQKITDDARHCVEELEKLSTTSVGQKLKKISRRKWRKTLYDF